MSKTNYSVAVLAGDGIGPEVMAAAEKVLRCCRAISLVLLYNASIMLLAVRH